MTCINEEDYLPLSGIQHFCFCRRQWALIHIEQQWAENLHTVEGALLHHRVHDPYRSEKHRQVIAAASLPVFSRALGARGVCDLVEFHQHQAGVPLFGREGAYLPVPVEYKKGAPKQHDADILQLTAQAICLEEMFLCHVPEGYLYYGETGRRVKVMIDQTRRQQVIAAFQEMHQLFRRGHTPKVKTGRHCRACSLASICLPKLCKNRSAASYIQSRIQGEL